jgi:hypothetical protein
MRFEEVAPDLKEINYSGMDFEILTAIYASSYESCR